MKKDENDCKREGTLPLDPESDCEVMAPPGDPNQVRPSKSAEVADPFKEHWKTIAERGISINAFPPRRKWLLNEVLPLGKCGVLAAKGGVGKTQALTQLALAVAIGKDWLGTFCVASNGNVLLALGEEDHEEIHRRFHRAAEAMGLSDEECSRAARSIVALPLAGIPVALTARDGHGNTTTTAELEFFQKRLQDREWRLIILDPLSRFAGDDTEIDNAAATRFVQAVETLSRAPGNPAVLVAHHSGKSSEEDGGTRIRGSSAIEDGFRWIATMSQCAEDKKAIRWQLKKSNYTCRHEDVFLRYNENGALVKCEKPQPKQVKQSKSRDDEKATGFKF